MPSAVAQIALPVIKLFLIQLRGTSIQATRDKSFRREVFTAVTLLAGRYQSQGQNTDPASRQARPLRGIEPCLGS